MASKEKNGFARSLARALARFYYPRIGVTGDELIPREGPVLVVANHPNSLIDPVLLGIAARWPVRLMAKPLLFDVPVLGALLRALGMVPAYRGSDDAKQVAKNLESLAAVARQLAAGGVMGIFPERKSHDATQLALVRSGAARLAMQAVAAGAAGLRMVRVGINYERKERFRSAVWLKAGRRIEAGRWLAMHGGEEHKAMRTLTQEIGARLRHGVTHLEDVRGNRCSTKSKRCCRRHRAGGARRCGRCTGASGRRMRSIIFTAAIRRGRGRRRSVWQRTPRRCARRGSRRIRGCLRGAGSRCSGRLCATGWRCWWAGWLGRWACCTTRCRMGSCA